MACIQGSFGWKKIITLEILEQSPKILIVFNCDNMYDASPLKNVI